MQEIIEEIGREIQDSYEAANDYAKKATDHARWAIEEAFRCGKLLETARANNRASWKDWLATNAPQISTDEAARWITGTKKIAQAGGIDALNPRQMLLFFGEDEKGEQEQQTNRDPDGTKWFSAFGRAVEVFSKQIEFRPITSWTDAERAAFRRRAEPIVKAWEML
jgi:hypothetical protein